MSSAGHALFAIGLAISWLNSSLHIALAERPVYAGSPRMFRGPVSRGRLVSVLAAGSAFFALLLLFVLRIQPELVAAGILLALISIRRVEIAQWHDDIVVRLGKYAPAGACLAGWLAADVALQLWGKPAAEARLLGWNASCGVMAGAYVLAGLVKLRKSGLGWVRADRQALLVAERAFAGPRWLRSLRLAVVRSKTASLGAGIFGLGVELGAIGLVYPPARLPVAAAVLALHGGFMLLLGYFEIEWLAVLMAIVLLGAPA